MDISVVVITYNEERNIGRCLASVEGIADEIIVLDSFSTDATPDLCRQYGARFFQHAFDGHIEQKNRALTFATHDWVLSLDADEALDETLRATILAQKQHPATHDGYSMNRLTNYCGQWVRHSGWYPDRKLRLFDRRKAQWGGQNPHDKIIMDNSATTAHLKGDLLHYSYYTEQEHTERARKYARIAAQAMHARGKRASNLQVVFSPLAKFLRNYVLKLGFLDGRVGFRICWVMAWETYLKYGYLRRMVS
jgi:glycosyltransferase involved in cell wall biosynthesis